MAEVGYGDPMIFQSHRPPKGSSSCDFIFRIEDEITCIESNGVKSFHESVQWMLSYMMFVGLVLE